MSTEVIGFKPADEKWEKMKKIWDNCEELHIPVPKEVDDFFNGETPDATGVKVDIPTNEWEGDGASGLEIEVEKIPKDVKIIRFVNSW
jgi:hypothetical protein